MPRQQSRDAWITSGRARPSSHRGHSRPGYTVIKASNGEAALAALERHAEPIQLLLSDVVMPVMGGREVARRVLETYPATQVIFMSGYPGDVLEQHGGVEIAVDFIAKPFTVHGLLAKVRAALDRSLSCV